MTQRLDILQGISGSVASFLYEMKRAREFEPGAKDENAVFETAYDEIMPFLHQEERLALAELVVSGLDRRSQCRLSDALIACLAPSAPTPSYRGLMADANEWADAAPYDVLRVYMAAIWARMNSEQQSKASAWFAGQVQEGKTQPEQRRA